jgi:uncharacterized RDD family membrane protein YckC
VDEPAQLHGGGEWEDTLTLVTPEGVSLTFSLAGVGSRFVGALVDQLIQIVLILAVLLGLRVFGTIGAVGISIGLFCVYWLYDVLFETLAGGQTPGKRAVGIRVVRDGGHPIGFVRSAVRNALRIVDFLPSAYLVGIGAILASRRNQRLGDLAAGAIVVRQRRASLGETTTSEPTPVDLVGSDLTGVGREELQTIRAFLLRRFTLEPQARARLASGLADDVRRRIVAPGTSDMSDEELLVWLVGTRSS